MEPFLVYLTYLWYKAKAAVSAVLLSGCITYKVARTDITNNEEKKNNG